MRHIRGAGRIASRMRTGWLLLPPLALAGCSGQSCGLLETGCFTDSGFDTSSFQTARIFYAGEAQTSDGHFVSGHFGYDIQNRAGDHLCMALSKWSEGTAPVAGGCPDCAWAFNLALSNGEATGDQCDAFGINGDEWDGLTGSWGFAPTFDYESGGTVFTLDTVILYYSKGNDWFPLAYNYGSRQYNTGNASDVAFERYYSYAYYY